MFYYLAAFILILYLSGGTLADQCLNCNYDMNLTSSEVLNATHSECGEKTKPSDLCLSMLSIEFDKQTASMYSGDVPERSLALSNGNTIITDLTTLMFKNSLTSRSITWIGADNAASVPKLNDIYRQSKLHKY